MNTRLIATTLASLITVGGALVHGHYSHRWGAPADLTKAAQRLDALPKVIGPWRHLADGESLTEFVRRELGLAGFVSRVYENAETGREISLLVMVGQPGRLVRHPPTVCYANRDNKLIGEASWIELKGLDKAGGSRFRLLQYERPNTLSIERFFVAYGHAVSGAWDAPSVPRLAYGAEPLLYKVQMLISVDPSAGQDAAKEDLTKFAVDFVAAAQESFFRRAVGDDADVAAK